MDSSGELALEGHVDQKISPNRFDLSGLYHLGRTLGRGHFAVVKLARHVNTGQLVAVKMIEKTKLDIIATSHLLQEVRCMRLVQHPNVVRLYEVIDTPTTLYLVMELAEGGDLYDYILRHEGGVDEDTAKHHFAQIVRAVAYCHQLHVVHRDLKPENVVFFPQQGAVKLTDFGFSNLFQPGMMLATSCGSLAYSAPEILLGEEYDAPAVDIWSLGVILYMLVCGVPPFQETNDSETLVMILDCRYCVPEHVSDNCKDLISRMLQKDPSCRASLEEIEAHHWLQGMDHALLSPEAPPHWLSEALSPTSSRAGLPECGDLLAAKSTQHAFFGPSQPSVSITLCPPPTEPLVPKNLLTLQQICEEEEEEEEMEGSVATEAEGSACLLSKEPGGKAEVANRAEDQDCREGEEEEGVDMIIEKDDRCVIADQPVSHCDKQVGQTSDLPASVLPGLVLSDPEEGKDLEIEPNNNTPKPPPLLPESNVPSSPVSSGRLNKEALRIGKEGEDGEKAEEAGRDDILTDRSQRQNALGTHNETALKAGHGKRNGIKLRERLFQFPLCEKALAFNIPTYNKPKILPLAQYNCCHVL